MAIQGAERVDVHIFNCGRTEYNLFINGASSAVQVGGTSSDSKWVPAQPRTKDGSVMTVDLNLTSKQNNGDFNLGDNVLTVHPTAEPSQGVNSTVVIPDQDYDVAQLYLFWTGFTKDPFWVFLNKGKIVSSNISKDEVDKLIKDNKS